MRIAWWARMTWKEYTQYSICVHPTVCELWKSVGGGRQKRISVHNTKAEAKKARHLHAFQMTSVD